MADANGGFTMIRRDFLSQILVGAAALATNTVLPSGGFSEQNPGGTARHTATRPVELRAVGRTIDVNGKSANVLGLQQTNGTPGLIIDADGPFDVQFLNVIDAPTLIHWHGLTPPWTLDGVPGNPASMLEPLETRRYTFPAGRGGTHWMHAHTLQEQSLLAAPLIVRTAQDRRSDEQEIIILFHDFSFKTPEQLLAGLQKGQMANDARNDTGHHMSSMELGDINDGLNTTNSSSSMDINDIEYDAYLANDRTLNDPEVVRVERNGRVRLRIINAATATAFTIDTGQITGSLIAVDGQDVEPITSAKFPISMGQRVDIRLAIPADGGAFPILGLREGGLQRTGIMLATPGASIKKLLVTDDKNGPFIGMGMETALRPINPLVNRPVTSHFDLSLVGDMAMYKWGIEGDEPRVRAGDRIEVAIRNMTMMSHPMHLHGHHFQVVGINGKRINGAVRDTVLVPSMATVEIALDAQNLGHWPFHCHNLYHMATGMMTYINCIA